MKNIYNIRKLIMAFITFIILIWAFFNNKLIGKIIISPFLICSIAIFFETLFTILKKDKLVNIFKYIFRISFFIYVFAFLIYSTYYTITNKEYSLFIVIGIFAFVSIYFFKLAFLRK